MLYRTMLSEYVIRGECSFFACRFCRTKYGWEHQSWCEYYWLSEPSCKDCRYFNTEHGDCIHPAQKKRLEDLPYEEDQRPV